MRRAARATLVVLIAGVALVVAPKVAGAATAEPPALTFGAVAWNTSATKSVAITVDAGYAVSLASGSGINVPFGFAFAGCANFKGPGTCHVKETFSPTATGLYSGTTNVFECPVAGGSCVAIPFSVSGTGISVARATPASFSFGAVAWNTSKTKSVTIKVDKGYAVSLASGSGINVPFGFAFDTCVNFTGPGTCHVKETFSPKASGAFSGTTNVFECPVAGGACVAIPFSMSGTGTSVARAVPATVDFHNVKLGHGATHSVAIKVDAGYVVSLASGPGINVPFGFGFDTCASFTGPGTCHVKETFSPSSVGTFSGVTNVFECPIVGGACVAIPFNVTGKGV